MISHEEMIGIVATEAVEAIHQSQQQQPKSEPSRESRECEEIAAELVTVFMVVSEGRDVDLLQRSIAAALQAERDKLKASQPTLPQPQTPHQ